MNKKYVIDEQAVWPRETSSAIELLRKDREAPIVILRSLTKDFALAGVRLGYVVVSPETAQRIAVQLPAWNVSGLAQAAGNAALADRKHPDRTLTMLALDRESFFTALRQTNLHIVPSRTHFCLIQVENAQQVRQRLLLHGLLVRDCTSFGLPQYIRVATRPAHEWQQG